MKALQAYIEAEKLVNGQRYSLSFDDEEGDKITLSNEIDLQAMKDLCEGKEYVKIYLSLDEPSPQKEKEEPLVESSESENKPNEEQKRSHSKERNQKRSHSKRDRSPPAHCKMERFQKMINQRVTAIVDERLKALLPCIENQLSQKDKPVVKDSSEVQHKGIECKGCGMTPINGIRYSCPICPNFNLCSSCEEKIEHLHDLVKMKKERQEKDEGDWRGQGKKWKDMWMKRGGCHGSGEHHGWNHHKGRHGDRQEFILNKRSNKLAKIFGGEPKDYTDFVQRTLEEDMKAVFQIYAVENKIDSKTVTAKRNMMKLNKLAAFFGKDFSVYTKIVEENPDKNFRELIKMLKEKGLEDYDGKNFKQMREKLGEEKKERRSCKKDRTLSKKNRCNRSSRSREQKLEESEEKVLDLTISSQQELKKRKSEENREKGKILIAMKDLFGDEKRTEMSKFIEIHFQEGMQVVVEKWIKQEFKN